MGLLTGSVDAGFVRRSYRDALLSLLTGCAILVGLGVAEIPAILAIRAERSLFERGTLASGVEIRGGALVHGRWLYTNDLIVEYTDGAGRRHTGRKEFHTLFVSAVSASTPLVKYDPRAPDDFALSWAVAVEPGRWAHHAVLLFLGLGAALALVWNGRRLLRHLAELRKSPASESGQAAGARAS